MAMSVALRRLLLLAGVLVGHVTARHDILPNEEPALTEYTNKDYTVDTASTAILYDPMDTAKLFVTLRSPTTQMVVFSPDRMPIDRSKIGGSSANKTIYKLILMQRACKMASGATSAASCYEQPFDTKRPMSPDRSFEFYRYGGTGGADPNDVLMMEASAAMPNGTTLENQWRSKGFRGCPKLEYQCNNHRAVSMRSGSPSTLRRHARIDWSDVVYNDAEFMESLIFENPPNYTDAEESARCEHRSTDCQWTPQAIEFLQEVLPIASGFEDARKREGQWLGTYHYYRRLPAHTAYLHFLRNRRSEMHTVKTTVTAPGDVSDYPKNVTTAIKNRIADATGIPSFGVKVKVQAASVRMTITISTISADS